MVFQQYKNYLEIKNDMDVEIFTDDEVIQELRDLLYERGRLYLNHSEIIYINEQKLRLWNFECSGILVEDYYDNFSMWFIPYEDINRYELYKVLEILKKYINNETDF